MISKDRICLEFELFLSNYGAYDKFLHELSKNRTISINSYVNGRLNTWGNIRYLTRNLVSDAISFMNADDGLKYWSNIQREWRKICDFLVPLDDKTKLKPKNKQLYNSIW